MSKIIILKRGDCLSNISKQERFLWETIWEHPENTKLRQQRKNPNILKEGDGLYIPNLELKEISAETEKCHVFVLERQVARFTLTLLDLGKPRANENYILRVEGRTPVQGKTDSTGTLSEPIPRNAREGLLLLGENEEKIIVNFGYVDPIEEISGVKIRLQNLGFYDGEIDDEMTSETEGAIAEFQRSVNLSGEGQLNDETRQALVAAHGD